MKFKNTKKTKKIYKKSKPSGVNQLPSNSRFITDKINIDDFAFYLGFLCIFVALLIISFSLYINIKEERRIASEKIRINSEINFWENQTEKYPEYRDAYFSLSLLNYEIGDLDASRLYLEKVLQIDANFIKGKEFREMLIGG